MGDRVLVMGGPTFYAFGSAISILSECVKQRLAEAEEQPIRMTVDEAAAMVMLAALDTLAHTPPVTPPLEPKSEPFGLRESWYNTPRHHRRRRPRHDR